MNKFSKFCVGTLCAIVGVGAVGGICYQEIPAFKTTVNNFFKNNDTKSNISIDKPQIDNKEDNENTVKPITPDDFKKIYKIELPTNYYSDSLYVKTLSNDNLLISSSVVTGILLFDASKNELTPAYLSGTNYCNFKELSNGDCLISNTSSGGGLLLYNSSNNTITQIYSNGYNFTCIQELLNGDYLISSVYYNVLLMYQIEDRSLVAYSIDSSGSYGFSSIHLLANGNCLLGSSDSHIAGLYLFNVKNHTLTKVYEGSYFTTFNTLNNCNVLFCSKTSYGKGLYCYNITTNEVTQLTTTNYYYDTLFELDNGNYLITSSNVSVGLHLYNPLTNELTTISSSNRYKLIDKLDDGNYLFSYSSYLYLYDVEANNLTQLCSTFNSAKYTTLANGDKLFSYSVSSGCHEVYIYSLSGKTVSKVFTSNYEAIQLITPLSNGDCLFANPTYSYLYLYSASEGKVNTLISKNCHVTSIIAQEDGTYFIETSDEFDYEYDPATGNIKLVYTVE